MGVIAGIIEDIPVGKQPVIFLRVRITVIHKGSGKFIQINVQGLHVLIKAIPHLLLDKNIVEETHIAVEECHKSVDLRSVGHMIGRVPGQPAVVRSGAHLCKGARNQVVDHGHPLGAETAGVIRQQQVVVHQSRAMADLYKQVLPHFQMVDDLCAIRRRIVVEQVPGDTGPLGLPVQPQASGAMVDVVVTDNGIDGGVEFDSGNLRAIQLLLVVDVMDMVVFDQGKGAAQMAHNSRLPAVVNIASPDGVGAYRVLIPALVDRSANHIPFILGTAFSGAVGPFVFVARLQVLADGNTAALCLKHLAVFDHPAL